MHSEPDRKNDPSRLTEDELINASLEHAARIAEKMSSNVIAAAIRAEKTDELVDRYCERCQGWRYTLPCGREDCPSKESR